MHKNSFTFGLLIFCILLSGNIFSQALNTNPEEGMGTYKNRVFFNLERYWDSTKVCNNPHKGWFIHYYDNGIKRYGNRLSPTDSLPGFPGLNDIYLRLAWAYLEPEEGVYNWAIIDSVINRWVSWGHTISFRITCKETDDLVYATPEWVKNAGAKGRLVDSGRAWAPDYGDPVFMEKLEAFHKAFAARYDGQPWVEYIDIGSIGEWGEGHTAFSGWQDVPVEVIKRHIDLFKRCYKKSKLIISDDIIGQRDTDDGADYVIYQYCLANGIGFRDDSANVYWYQLLGFNAACIRTPEIFSKTYRTLPVVLESDHYQDALKYQMWKKGIPFEAGIKETHATFIGFHYYPHEWLKENYQLAQQLTNICGYWYFPKFAMMPDTLRTKSDHNYIRLTWENHGVAPAYQKFYVSIKLLNKETGKSFTQILSGSDNRTWMPDEITAEQCSVNLDKNLPEGRYDLLLNMKDECGFHDRNIELALKKEREIFPGWYKLGEVIVK
jgi:hypothetical protein